MKRILILICIIFIINTSCNTTEPTEILPGRRDYVWTVDTLNTPNDLLGRFWASSPSDIWRTSDGDWDKSISHFDGKKWSSFGITGIIVPWAVFGFSSSNIYLGSENGKIWKYNGSSWNQFAELTKDGNKYIHFENIWGDSPNDFYAFGAYPDDNSAFNKSVIAHFNNNSWGIVNTIGLIGYVEHLYKNSLDNKIYFQLTRIGDAGSFDSTIVYEYLNNRYLELYSSVEMQEYKQI